MSEVRAAGVAKTGAAANGEQVSVRRFLASLRLPLLLFLVLQRLRGSKPLGGPTPLARPRARRRRETPCPDPPPRASVTDGPAGRLEAIESWIGAPAGRGRIVPAPPAVGVHQDVRVWEGSGELAMRRIRIGRALGAGLAGTVYEVRDDNGARFVEKHYGQIPVSGTERLGRWLAGAIFSLFRQAPLSYRELPEAVVTIHLANRFIVAASTERFGRPITPRLLYTRYDARTGGYVQAFEYVEGRPLRPTSPGLPLLGEAALVLPTMRCWRDFLARELGFWGLARQVDPANVNAYGNVWITQSGQIVLLDLVPGIPGFLEPRYVWGGLRRGQFPPFADAIDCARLARWLESHTSRTPDPRGDLDLLRLAVERWQASEPRLVSSPLRPLRVVTDPRVRAAVRRALLTHLEVKGAVTSEQAQAYRAALEATGRFPKLLRHSMLKMAPLPIHRALVDLTYAWRLAHRMSRLPCKLARAVAAGAPRLARSAARLVVEFARHLASRELRLRTFRARVAGWIEEERRLGRLTDDQAAGLRGEASADEQTADLAGLFVVHLSISALKHSLLGPSAVWIGLALATQTWWLALPALVAPVLRVAAAAAMGFARCPGLLMLCALPDVGVLACPIYLARRPTDLGTFIVRVFAQKLALAVPAFGQRGGLVEMAAVGAMQALVVGPARVLPWAFAVAIVAVLQGVWWAALVALSLYGGAVAYALVTSRHGHHGDRPRRCGPTERGREAPAHPPLPPAQERTPAPAP